MTGFKNCLPKILKTI